MKRNTSILGAAITAIVASNVAVADVTEALTSGKAYGDFRLRYESVDQDNDLKDASAFTLRSRLGYTTGSVSGFSATMEFEDSRVVIGQDNYAPTTSGYSVIADPETTELDQALIQYKTDVVTVKAGRQVYTLDGQRYIGHVGWRQDRQTFDALTVKATPIEKLTINYAYLGQRNRILGETADVDSNDHLLNASYASPIGKVTFYDYMLEVDSDTDNGLDTVGISLMGSQKTSSAKILYSAEFASQTSTIGSAESEATYTFLEAGVVLSGVTAKLGYEVLGSDEGNYGFSTPLATLHKFNGWADTFLATPAQGLVDTYASIAAPILGGKFVVSYHTYAADEATEGMDNYGSEFDVLYARKFGKNYNAGIKYAAYSAEDYKVDTDKLWLWVGASF